MRKKPETANKNRAPEEEPVYEVVRTRASETRLDSDLLQLSRLRKKTRQKVIDLITGAAKVEVVGAKPVGSSGLILHLLIDDSPVTLEVSGLEVVDGDLEAANRHLKGTRGRLNRVKRPETLSIQELRERHLPLYWNEKWLRDELDRLGSYAEIARVHNFASPVTIASYAKRKFGIDIQAEYAKKREAVYEDSETGDFTHYELAEKHGVALATVYRWLKERREGKDRQARRGQRTVRK